MSRIIKFRAWDNVHKLITPVDWVSGGWDEAVVNKTNERFTIMQFTGLYDINNTEIYEGDLLNIGLDIFGFIKNKNEFVTYEVRVVGCDFTLYRADINLNWGRLSRLSELGWICQVVGNIYKNEIQQPQEIEIKNKDWFSVKEKLPEELQTVWISNGKGWTTLGCRSSSDADGNWSWCETNGVIYEHDRNIVSECDADDLDVEFWHPLPFAPKLPDATQQ